MRCFMSSKTSRSAQASTSAHVTKKDFAELADAVLTLKRCYNEDLAYFLKRMDKIEDAVHSNSRNFSSLALLVSEMNRQIYKPEPNAAETPITEIRGNCRIIHFRSEQNQ